MSQNLQSLLSPQDPDPVELVNPQSDFPILLVCEHAGQQIPAALDGLGLAEGEINAHIGWDIGARAVTLQLAQLLGAPAILQRYSRLVIDCNRPPQAFDAMPSKSDGIDVPGNQRLDAAQRQVRISEIFDPLHRATSALLDHPTRKAAISIHSFTRSMAGVQRPWDVGLLFRHDTKTSSFLQSELARLRPKLKIGMNQPYQIDDASDWFVPQQGEARGIAHSLIEIRNDHIATETGQAAFAKLLAPALTALLRTL